MARGILRKFFMGIISGILAAVLVWLITDLLLEGFFYRFEATTYDWRVWWRSSDLPEKPIEDVVILDVDARSINKLGKFHQWPRTYWVRALEYLKQGGARWVGFDFIFDRDLRHPEEDRQFIDAIQKFEGVIGSLYFAMADSEHFLYPMASEPAGFEARKFAYQLPDALTYRILTYDRMEPDFGELLNVCKGVGFVNLMPDGDGVVRRLPLFMRFNDQVYPAFTMSLFLRDAGIQNIEYDDTRHSLRFYAADGSVVTVPVDSWGRALIYYHGPFQTFRYISFYDLLMGFIPAEYFKDRIVLVGSSLPGLFDLRVTPLHPAFPGVEINANVLYQFMHGNFILELSLLQKLLYLLAVGVFAGVLLAIFRPIGGVLTIILICFLLLIASFFTFSEYNIWAPLVAPVLVVLLTFTINYIYRYLGEEKDKRQIRRMFSHYVSPSLVDSLIKDPAKLKLGGEKKVCTVLFSDLVGFTRFSEKLPPEKLVQLLNAYLTVMTEIIFENEGTLDKYQGDAIMAIFGAPVDIENHALKACRAALIMQRRLKQIREDWKKRNLPQLFQRIGINTGPMVVGNMGSLTRFDYTVVGDAVNLGSRLEGANKLYGTNILMGEETYQNVKDQVVARALDLLRVKGKQEPVKVYELVALKDEPLDVRTRELLNYFQQGFQHYLTRNWEWAINQFRQALQINPDDGPSRLYLLRCQDFLQTPPEREWNGVYSLKTK